MDWVKLIKDKAKTSGVLHVNLIAEELGTSEFVVWRALSREEKRGLVEHLGKKIFINRLTNAFSGKELINVLRLDSYLSLETVLRESGVSTQTPSLLTCVTTGRAYEFSSGSIRISYRHIAKQLFWGFKTKRTLHGTYNVADPEKAVLDWLYLNRQIGLAVTDELNFLRLSRNRLKEYANRFPASVRRQLADLLAFQSESQT